MSISSKVPSSFGSPIKVLSSEETLRGYLERPLASSVNYFAMYSSLLNGVVLDPQLMLIPLDDHMVHRGDGVFEAIKFVDGGIYLLDSHLLRLLDSARQIGLKAYAELDRLRELVVNTVRLGAQQAGSSSGLIRIFMSRGPGSFSVNPYDTQGTHFFVVVTGLTPPPARQYEQGARVGLSQIGAKEPWMATVKSCNYLPNVMMKKEAIDHGLDFMVGVDRQGFLAESSTENIVIVSAEGYLLRPKLEQILRGTTMTRTFELASELLAADFIKGIEGRDISLDEVKKAKEIMLLGTTLDVLPVGEFATVKKSVGPVARELLRLLRVDQERNSTFY